MSKIICDECKHEFSSESVNIQEQGFVHRGVELRVSFFTCPKCNKIYVIQVMDEKYEELREDLEKTKKRIQRNHGSNNIEFARTLNAMIAKKADRLRNHCVKLMNKYNGTFTFVASENNPKEQTIKYLP